MFFTFVACSTLVLGGINMRQVYHRPTDECMWIDSEQGVKIVSVQRGGTAERAGILVGDILLQIGGENATTSVRAQAILDRQVVGDIVSYLILRQGDLITPRVEIVGGGFHPLYLVMCCIGFIYWVVGLWIGWMRPLDPKARVVFYLFLSFMLFWTLNLDPASVNWFRWVVRILRAITFTTIPGFFLYFFLLYPTRHPLLDKKPWIQILLFSPTLLLLLSLVWVFVLGYSSRIQIALPFGIGLWGLYFVLGLFRLVKCYGGVQNRHLRQQIRVLQWGISIGFISPVVIIIMTILKIQSTVANYSTPLMGLIPLVFAYAVVRHRLMDIEIIVKKSFVYTLLTGLIVGFYFIVVQSVGRFIQDIAGLTGTLVLMMSTLFIAVLFDPARKRIQSLVDRAFYREANDYRETLRQFTRALNTLIDPDILMTEVLAKICETMHIENGYFFVLEEDHHQYGMKKHYPPVVEDTIEIVIPDDGLLCQMMLEEQSPVFLSDLDQPSVYSKEYHQIPDGVISVPLFYQKVLLGFLVLGEKLSGIPYSTADFDLLDALADQVAVTLENGRLHRALTEQERLKHELEIARRIQLNALPQSEPCLPGFDIYGCSIPANEVGGDYYDYISLSNNRLGIVLGDVSGKGTSAAFYQSKIQGFIRALFPANNSPKLLLTKVNKLTFENIEDKSFATLVVAVLQPDERIINIARAGHTPILFFEKKKGLCHWWLPQGVGLAIDEGTLFNRVLNEEIRSLTPGDVLLFYSDGVTEAEDRSGEEFGEDRLEDVFKQNVQSEAQSLGQTIINAVHKFRGDYPQKDDMTLVVIKVCDEITSVDPEITK